MSGAECIFIPPKNTVKLFRPGEGTGREVPAPAAEVCEELGLLQLSLVRNELRFGLLALGTLSDGIGPDASASRVSDPSV